MDTYKWGLVPFWVKDIKGVSPMINARCETLSQKPFFKQCLARRRCLIPADGFYEWKKVGKSKLPVYIHLPERQLFAFAGLFDEWRSPEGELLRTCVIITHGANAAVSPVHDRMPVIVRPELEKLWLDGAVQEIKALQAVFAPFPEGDICLYPVSPAVNSPAVDLPGLLEPILDRSALTNQVD